MLNKRITTRKLVFMALFIALNVVLTRFGSVRLNFGGIEAVRIGIGALPVIFTGVFFGPIAGGIVGALGDVIGFYMFPMGAFMPHFTLSAFLTGFIPGAIVYNWTDKYNPSFLILLIAIGIGQITTSILLTPYFLNQLFGVPYIATVPSSIISQAINIPLYAYLIKVMMYKCFSLFAYNQT